MTDNRDRFAWLFNTADRVEQLYLAALRIMVLILASLALLVAIWVAADGLFSLMTSTKVKTDPVTVTGTEVLQVSRDKQAVAATDAATTPAVPDTIRKAHDAFLRGPFETYYQLYLQTSNAYRKPEDKALTKSELAERLGYDLNSYAWGDNLTAKLFVNDTNYTTGLLEAARQVATDASYRAALAKYKAAQKTAKACHTEQRRQRGWNSYSTSCDGWWQSPIGCPAMIQVSVQVCEPAYPNNIVSPDRAFVDFDQSYRELWQRKTTEASEKHDAEVSRRMVIKASGVPKLSKALMMLGGFLAVMFLFIVIAVERHLRRLKVQREKAEE